MDTPVLAQIADYGIQVMAVVLMVVVTWGARRLIRWVEDKLDTDIQRGHEIILEQLAGRAVGYAEEYARRKARDGITLSGPDKFEAAADSLLRWARDRGWDDLGRREAHELIEGWLGQRRESVQGKKLSLPTDGPIPDWIG